MPLRQLFRLLLTLLLPLTAFTQGQGPEASFMLPGNRADYDYSVIGGFDHSVHIVQVTKVRPQQTGSKAKLQIFILSEDMKLQATNEIRVDSLPVNVVFPPSFETYDKGYFMTVRYRLYVNDTLRQRQKMFAIDSRGNIIDTRGKRIYHEIQPIEAATSAYAITSRGDALYAAVIQHDSSNKQLSIRKTHLGDAELDQMDYGVTEVRLSYPRLALGKDSIIWIAGLAEKWKKYPTDGGAGDMILLARMDTGLSEVAHPRITPFPAPRSNKRENFVPDYILPADSNLVIVSIGRMPLETRGGYTGPYSVAPLWYDQPTMDNYISRRPDFIRRVDYNFGMIQPRNILRTLRVSLAGPQCDIISDTVIQGNANSVTLELANTFYVVVEKGLVLLCGQQFSTTRSGIRYFFIDYQGMVIERDIRVNPKYIFHLPGAKRISSGSVVVPFYHKGHQGFLKLDSIEEKPS